MNYVSYRIGLYKLNRKRQKESQNLSKWVEEARKKGGTERAEEAYQGNRFLLDEIDERTSALVTRYLMDKANKRFLPCPLFYEESELWERGQITGKYYLTAKGITEIRKTIREDLMERLEIFSPYVSILFGLIGAITGLIAVIKR